jgi:hypothetical protein
MIWFVGICVFGFAMGWFARSICTDRSFTWRAFDKRIAGLRAEGAWYEGDSPDGCVGSGSSNEYALNAVNAAMCSGERRIKRVEVFYGS